MIIFHVMLKVFFLSLMFAVAPFALSHADIYKYVDESGVIHYTDTPMGTKISTGGGQTSKAETESSKPRAVRSEAGYTNIINTTSKKYSVDPSLVKAVIKTESGYNPSAISRKGAMGLMQLMPSTAREMGVYNAFNPEENIEGGTRYLRYLIDRFGGNLTLALAAYNSGPSRVERTGNVPPITETREYVKKVLSLYGGQGPIEGLVQAEPVDTKNRIYRITLKDGTVLFTNSSLFASEPSSF